MVVLKTKVLACKDCKQKLEKWGYGEDFEFVVVSKSRCSICGGELSE